jgi:hypothetical protein
VDAGRDGRRPAEGGTSEDVAARLREAAARPLDAWREVYESFAPVDVKTGERMPRVPPPGAGSRQAAVLVPVLLEPNGARLVYTVRRDDLQDRHERDPEEDVQVVVLVDLAQLVLSPRRHGRRIYQARVDRGKVAYSSPLEGAPVLSPWDVVARADKAEGVGDPAGGSGGQAVTASRAIQNAHLRSELRAYGST